MKVEILIYLLSFFTNIEGQLLKCPENANQTIICTINEDHMSDRVPRPIPRNITSSLMSKTSLALTKMKKQ